MSVYYDKTILQTRSISLLKWKELCWKFKNSLTFWIARKNFSKIQIAINYQIYLNIHDLIDSEFGILQKGKDPNSTVKCQNFQKHRSSE